jgi:hypothetical protein
MGRRPIGDRAMTAAERQRRQRQKYEAEIISLRNEIEVLKATAAPRKPLKAIKIPAGSAADQGSVNALARKLVGFHSKFEPLFEAWLASGPTDEARACADQHLQLIGEALFEFASLARG